MVVSLTGGDGIQLILWNVNSRLSLTPKRDNGLATVATDDRNDGLAWVARTSELSDKGLGTDDIESGDTEKLLGVKLAGGFEDLGSDRDGAVNGVGDDQDVRLRAPLSDAVDDTLDDTGVDLEEVITGHTRLAYGVLETRLSSKIVMVPYEQCQQE